jgi:hypothetical protein
MRSDAKKSFYFQTDANSLGGYIDQPFNRIIPSQASVSLPAVGGHVAARTEAFNFEEIISCRSAYTRVSGREIHKDGPWSTQVTSVVEGLNILEIVTAERLVAQISVDYSIDEEYPRVSLAGSHFDGLKIGGFDAYPRPSSGLMNPACGANASQPALAWPDFLKTGQEQAGKLLDSVQACDNRDAYAWIVDRFGWMASERKSGEDGCVLCSLVEGVDQGIPGCSFCHVVEIPDFGQIFLGELLVSPHSVQLSMIRAELGCGTAGRASASSGSVGGRTVPP